MHAHLIEITVKTSQIKNTFTAFYDRSRKGNVNEMMMRRELKRHEI